MGLTIGIVCERRSYDEAIRIGFSSNLFILILSSIGG
jgi:hypothetical protein